MPANSSGSATFSSAVMVGTRWNDWKTMPMLPPRISGQLVLARGARSRGRRRAPAGGRPLQAGDDHQQRGLARAARADHGDGFARRDLEIDPLRISTGPARLASVSETSSQSDDGVWPRSNSSCQVLPRALRVSTSITQAGAREEGHMMRTGAIERRLANMVFRVLLCNWLIAALAIGGRPALAEPAGAHRRARRQPGGGLPPQGIRCLSPPSSNAP